MATAETFHIKNEGRPRRCEICHQDDVFDSLSGRCGRCSGNIAVGDGTVLPITPDRPDFLSGWWNGMALICTGLVGIFCLPVLIWYCARILWAEDLLEVIESIGIIGFLGSGYYLGHMYFRIVLREISSERLRWAGRATIGYYFLALIWLVLLLREMDPLGVIFLSPWLLAIFYLMVYGGFLMWRGNQGFRTSAE